MDCRVKFNYDLNNDFRFFHVGQSECWSWQLGTRLQWHPKNENEIICYNRIVDGKYGAVLQNIKTKNVEEKFSCPIYDIDKIGKYGITISQDFIGIDRDTVIIILKMKHRDNRHPKMTGFTCLTLIVKRYH